MKNLYVLIEEKSTASSKDLPAREYYGDIKELNNLFTSFNKLLRHGVFELVQVCNGKGRCEPDITHIRSFYADIDKGTYRHGALPPTRVVESSPGKFQLYWDLKEPLPVTNELVYEWKGVEHAIVYNLAADLFARDLSRVLRTPGFLHQKREPFMVRYLEQNGPRYTFSQVREAYGYIAQPITVAREATLAIDPDINMARFVTGIKKVPPPDRGDGLNFWIYKAAAWAIGNLGLDANGVAGTLNIMSAQEGWRLDTDEVIRTVANAERYARKQAKDTIIVELT